MRRTIALGAAALLARHKGGGRRTDAGGAFAPPGCGEEWRAGTLRSASGLGDVPNVSAIVAFDVAWLLVVLPEVERLTLVGPLFAAVIARDDGPVARVLGVSGNHERRPIGRALGVASGLVGRGVPVKGVE